MIGLDTSRAWAGRRTTTDRCLCRRELSPRPGPLRTSPGRSCPSWRRFGDGPRRNRTASPSRTAAVIDILAAFERTDPEARDDDFGSCRAGTRGAAMEVADGV